MARINSGDPTTLEDPEPRESLAPAAHRGAPRLESQAIHAHVR